MAIDPSILDKIAGLLQLAEKNSNANESASAAAAAQSLLTKYRLTKADLSEHSTEKREEPETAEVALFSAKRIPDWKKDLASTVARVNGCRIYFSSRSVESQGGGHYRSRREFQKDIKIVGMPSDIEVVRYFFSYLFKEIERLSDVARANKEIKGKRDGTSFKIGASGAVGQRLWESLNETKAEAKKELAAGTSQAIIALDKSEAEVNEFYDTISRKFGKATVRPVKTINHDALNKGSKAGRSIALNRAMGSGGHAGPKALTA